jgi:gallate decarboxylase subunit D
MISRRISLKEKEIEVFAQINAIGDDLLVILWGGTEPHIGAIGMGQPRSSLRSPQETSATSSVFTFIGHKEDGVAKWMAEELARRLNKKVVVSCGMHWDELTDEGIDEVIEICKKIGERIITWAMKR